MVSMLLQLPPLYEESLLLSRRRSVFSKLILKHENMSEKISIKIQSLTPNIIAQREYLMPFLVLFTISQN